MGVKAVQWVIGSVVRREQEECIIHRAWRLAYREIGVNRFQDLAGTGRAVETAVVELVNGAVTASLFALGNFIKINNVAVGRGETKESAIVVVWVPFCRTGAAAADHNLSAERFEMF